THVMYSAADTAPPDMSTLSLHDALPISTLMVKAGKCSSLCMSRYARPLSPGHRNYRRPGVETSMSSLKPNLPTTSTRTSQFNSRSEEHTSELQSREKHVCRLLLEKRKKA